MKNFHSVGHRVDPLSAPALGGARPPVLQAAFTSSRVDCDSGLALSPRLPVFPHRSLYNHSKMQNWPREMSGQCYWLLLYLAEGGVPCTRSPKETWSHFSRFEIHTASASILGSAVPCVGWRTTTAGH